MKFRYLQLDLNTRLVYNCHAAEPHRVDINWLKNNPGQLFNDEINVSERKQMLANERNASCGRTCWPSEDKGYISPRLTQSGVNRTHLDPHVDPEIVNLNLFAECNLSCSYCCKQHSTTWRQDLINNGSYRLTDYTDERYALTNFDKVLHKVSRPVIQQSSPYRTLLDEFWLLLPKLKMLDITGGEPLLDNDFFDKLSETVINDDITIRIFTGLKVSQSRLERILTKLSKIKNVVIMVSAENIKEHAEFNRYGTVWEEFESNLALIRQHGIKVEFNATVSALTIFGFVDFANYYKDDTIHLCFVFQPPFMSPNVLDTASKQSIIDSINNLPQIWQDKIAKAISGTPDELHRKNLSEFLKQFVSRRPNLSYNIFPRHFLEWLDIDVVS